MSTVEQQPLFLRACFNEHTERTPVWLMRQAGRYMAEYRAIRKDVDFWTLCKTPELCCEVTLQPIEAFGMDAAIIFSDLLVPLPPMGASVTFGKGMGPVIEPRIDRASDVDKLGRPDVADTMGYVGDAVNVTAKALPKDVPLIGFAGAPFTLAGYLIEGQGSKTWMKTKAFLHQEPKAAEKLFGMLADITIDLLKLQMDNGARAVQVFDSWVGALDPEDYKRWGLAYTRRIVEGVRREGVPVIVFAKGTGTYLDLVAQCGADVIGVDWTQPLDRARALVGPNVALQGNLDPGRLLGPWDALRPALDRVLDAAGDGKGHIFNLGHGIDRHTDPAQVKRLVDHVRTASAARRG
ncbi:MAG: uroporphyrinogen decarboxylase [Myxococcales bacterium]|nr:uroporphyrinogen decarboxylase [Myxococcales bacterium]MCB9526019.1 uroporphyrinogen decarboxylase [Myxococcales bacterium]